MGLGAAGSGPYLSDQFSAFDAPEYWSSKEVLSEPTHVEVKPVYYDGLEIVVPSRPPQDHEIPEAITSTSLLKTTLVHSSVSELAEKPDAGGQPVEQRRPWYRRRMIMALTVLFVVLAIIGAVLGGVLGSRRPPKRRTLTSATSSASSASSSSAVPSTSAGPPTVQTDSRIAAISFKDNAGVTQYRPYYQDPKNNVRESPWNSTARKWYLSNPTVGTAKPNTAIAANVITPADLGADKAGNGLAGQKLSAPQINLYYLSTSNSVVEIQHDDSEDIPSWTQGSLSGTTVAGNTSLATIWQSQPWCINCPNTRLLVYRGTQGTLHVLNGTHGPVSDTQAYVLNTTAQEGTGLGLTWQTVKGFTPGLRLFYQMGDGHISSHDWESPGRWKQENAYNYAQGKPAADGWQNREFIPLDSVPNDSEIAAWTSSTILSNDQPALLQTLCSGSEGVYVIGWLGSTDGGAYQPTNVPSVFDNVRKSSSVSANGDGHVFAVLQDGGIGEWWVDNDGTTWHGGDKAVDV